MRTKIHAALTAACFLISTVISFSQVSHNDSLDYFQSLKMTADFGDDFRGKTIQNLVMRDNKGNLLTHDSLQSKITVINFWFEACAPCQAEFLALEKLYNNNKSKKGFQFISITPEPDSVIERIRKKFNLTYPIYYLSPDSCRKIMFRSGYPLTLIVNKQLEIVYSIVGGPTDSEYADKRLNYFIQAEINRQLLRNPD